MHPQRWFVGHLDPHAECRCWDGHCHHDEEGRAVGWVSEGIVEAANLTAWGKCQKANEQAALPASGASAFEPRLENGIVSRELRPHGRPLAPKRDRLRRAQGRVE